MATARSTKSKTTSSKPPKNGQSTSSESKTRTETFEVKGEKLLEKVKQLVHEGNVRKITIKDKKGKSIAEFPLTIGVVGAVVIPVLAAIGAIAALITECSITVERDNV